MKVTKWGKTCRLAIAVSVFGGLPLTTEMLSATELQTAYLSVQMESATLRELFDLIEKRFHYSFLIRNNDINLEEKIRLDVDKMSVEEILTNALKNQHADFFINDKRIVVYKKISKPVSDKNTILPGIQQSKGQVKGQVIDAVTGEPVIGASIIEKGTTNGGITDINGNFSLKLAGNENTIQISYIGYITQTIKVTSDRMLYVRLKEDTQA
ncbi:carboxypeptidase-like regulatory domain-containing protein, partial [Parabacteroides goldsteinii]|uniref:carboxypeptidase-like regulatory domain-containing protein n=2 Tax=Parabacteroides TaxID=375288 RepID=UPI0026DD7EAB